MQTRRPKSDKVGLSDNIYGREKRLFVCSQSLGPDPSSSEDHINGTTGRNGQLRSLNNLLKKGNRFRVWEDNQDVVHILNYIKKFQAVDEGTLSLSPVVTKVDSQHRNRLSSLTRQTIRRLSLSSSVTL